MSAHPKRVLWWGRFDPDYSRNRILRDAFTALGWESHAFRPLTSALGAFEAYLRRLPTPALVFVPCFRQRDIAAARRFSRARGVPLLVDPLISAYDKQVSERAKFPETGGRARRLLRWEQRLLQSADALLADTDEHAQLFAEVLGVPRTNLHVVPVGAEQPLFTPAPSANTAPNNPPEVLFYGSFIALQGPDVVVEAARLYRGPPVRWVLLGAGALLGACKKNAHGLANLTFEEWLPYPQLPARIRRADILLGVFGSTPKAQRVIPNKVFQALACGKPLVTCAAPAYPAALRAHTESGIRWVPAGDTAALARAVSALASEPARLVMLGTRARASYERFFSAEVINNRLQAALAALRLMPARE
jgi:glycosyltransferase involved in cell wall biosynthesis